VNLDLFIEEEKIYLDKKNLKKIGPHGIYAYKNKIITANNYDNSISMVDINNYETESYFIGIHCNDLSVYDNKAYVICGDSDDIIVFDLEKKTIVEAIPCGNLPHSIYICKRKNLIIVANMNSDSITIIDCAENGNIKNIRVGAYPTKAVITPDGLCKRESKEIGIHAVRGGNIIGDHEIIFAGKGECIEIKHTAISRDVFAIGALKACEYIYGKQKGLYSMDDVVNISI